MMRLIAIVAFLLYSFRTTAQERIGLTFPANQKKSFTYFSPYVVYGVMPRVMGVLKVGDPYDSLNSRVSSNYFSDSEFIFETPDSLRTVYESETGLKVLVDTVQQLRREELFYKTYKYDSLYASPKYLTLINKGSVRKVRLKKNRTVELSSTPVYIYNPTNEVKRVFDQDYHLNIIQEVLDPNGEWREMEIYQTGICGMGFGWKKLPPNHFLVTTVLKYSGSFKTLARIKFDNGRIYYSEPYRIGVNPGFFSDKIRTVYLDGHVMEVR